MSRIDTKAFEHEKNYNGLHNLLLQMGAHTNMFQQGKSSQAAPDDFKVRIQLRSVSTALKKTTRNVENRSQKQADIVRSLFSLLGHCHSPVAANVQDVLLFRFSQVRVHVVAQNTHHRALGLGPHW